MPFIIGYIFLFVGLSYILWIILYPLHDEIPSPEYCYKKSKVIWGLWNTGADMRERGLIEKYHSKIKRILLMNPESDGFQENLELTSGNELLSKKEIIDLTKLANQKGIELRWYDKLQHNTITFYDYAESCGETPEPRSEKAWCVLRELKPHVPRKNRPMYKLMRKKDEQEFNHQLSTFNNIWENNSKEPSKIA